MCVSLLTALWGSGIESFIPSELTDLIKISHVFERYVNEVWNFSMQNELCKKKKKKNTSICVTDCIQLSTLRDRSEQDIDPVLPKSLLVSLIGQVWRTLNVGRDLLRPPPRSISSASPKLLGEHRVPLPGVVDSSREADTADCWRLLVDNIGQFYLSALNDFGKSDVHCKRHAQQRGRSGFCVPSFSILASSKTY